MARARSTSNTPALFDLGEEPAEKAAPPERPRRSLFVRVAVNRPVRCEFTYGVPDEFVQAVQPGVRVAVPFGRTRQVAVVVAVEQESELNTAKIKDLYEVLDAEPVIDEGLLGLTRWIAERYAASWGEALAAVLPAPLKRERGARQVLVASAKPGVGAEQLAELEERFPKQHRLLRTLVDTNGEVELRDLLRQLNLSDSPARSLERRGWILIERRDASPDELISAESGRTRPEQLSPAQEEALRVIRASLGEAGEPGKPSTILLEGVTGSGKTEVYLRAIEEALEQGRSAIVLVPEIALTPQTVGWFRSRFADVAVLHSKMTDVQRLHMWQRLRHGEARVVVGARSAIFAPVRDLGIIVVDEEHEPSFKQGSVPRYHARDVAVERARREGAVCILGSATPSLESWHAAREGRFQLVKLPERVGGGAQPDVHVVDMRLDSQKGKGSPLFSRLLKTLMKETLDAGEQAIVFLNRRGFVPVLWCPGCEATVRCASCDMSMTLHRRIQRLVCHACCEERAIPKACPSCTRPGLRFLGVGSERVESELKQLWPNARVRRMDSDTMRRREDYEETLDAFGRHELDVLVGTQMIAKGLDFPRVTLVGIISADMALHLPDFRASERTYQLIAQVAGRAGRSDLRGRIVVQTIAPEHPAIQFAAKNAYHAFAEWEDVQREDLLYPPHGRLMRVLFDDTEEKRVTDAVSSTVELLRKHFVGADLEILGPSPAPMALLRGRHRHHLLVKAPLNEPAFDQARDLLVEHVAGSSRPRVAIDVDPTSLG